MESQVFELTTGISPTLLRGLFLGIFYTSYWVTVLVVCWKQLGGTEKEAGDISKASATFVIAGVIFMALVGVTVIF